MCRLFKVALVLVSVLAAVPVLSNAQTWPMDSDWRPIAGVKSDPVVDPAGDVSGVGQGFYDIVGAGSDAAGYLYFDGNTIFFRVRLADSPQRDSSSWNTSAFYVLVDANHIESDVSYDYAVVFDATSSTIELGTNYSAQADWCNDQVESVDYTYPAPPDFTGNARIVPAGTMLGGGSDVFLDIQIPLTDWFSFTGETDPTTVQIVLGTGSNAGSVDKDRADLECGETWASITVGVESVTWGHLQSSYRD